VRITRALAAGAGFLLLVAVFLGPGAFWDRSLPVGDGLYYTDPSFRAVATHVFTTRPANFLVDIDLTLQAVPFRRFTQASLARGEIPWWNPDIAMGMPFVGLGAGVFEPVAALAGFVVPPDRLGNAVVVVGLLIGAAGMAGLLRALGASPAARALGVIAFAFGGWTVVWLGRINFSIEMWMPWLFWAVERFLARPGAARAGAVALGAALVCLPGYLQSSFHVLAAVGVYAAARAWGLPGARGRRGGVLGALTLAVLLGVAVTAFQIVPILEFVAQSDLPSQGRSRQAAAPLLDALARGVLGEWDAIATEGPTLLTALSPHFFGAPQAETWWWPWSNFAETTVALGLLPLGFALWAAACRRAIPGVGVWLVLAAAALAVACALPLANLVNYLPGFRVVNNGRLRLVYHFALAVAAARGFDHFRAAEGRRRARGWAIGWAAGALLVPIVAWGALAALVHGVRMPPVGLLLRAEAPLALELAVFVAVTAAWTAGRLGPRGFAALVVLLTYAELHWFFHDFTPSVPSGYVAPPTSVTRLVARDPARPRVASSAAGELMPPNTKLSYGIADVDLFSVLTVGRYAALQAAVSSPPPAGQSSAFRAFRFRDPGAHRGLIDLMGVGYAVVPATGRDPWAGVDPWRLVYAGEVKVYRNPAALPRAFLVERAVVAADARAALATVTAAGFDPRAAVVLEAPVSDAPDPPHAPDPPGTVDLVALENNRVALRATVARAAWLVLADAYYPGWRARVDGVEAPVHRANFLFRAVRVLPGTHEVVFVFAPRAYAVAAATSGVALLAIAGSLAWEPLRRRRPGAARA